MTARNEKIKKIGLFILCVLFSFGAVGREAFVFQKDNRSCMEANVLLTEALPEASPGRKILLADLTSTNRIRTVSLYFGENAPEYVEVQYRYPLDHSRTYKKKAAVYDGKAEFDFRVPKQIAYMEFSYDMVLNDAFLPEAILNAGAAAYQVDLSGVFLAAAAGTILLWICVWVFDITKRRYPFLLLLMSVFLFWMASKTAYHYGMGPLTLSIWAVSILCAVAVSCCLGGCSDEEA